MAVSRRTVIKGAALGAVAGGAALTQLPTAAAAPAGFPSPLLFHSPKLAPFRDALPRLPVVTGTDITVRAENGVHRFHADLPEAPCFGYSGQGYLGPVIEARSGITTTVHFQNRLGRHIFADDIDTTIHGAAPGDAYFPRTNLHLHGAVTPPRYDGHPQSTAMPGGDQLHEFQQRQEAAMLWYHDHALGITRLNVMAGLASVYLLRDEWDTGLPDNPLGLPTGDYEMPLVLQEKILKADGSINARSTHLVPQGRWEGGAVGDLGVVNGKVWPELEVTRGLYRFRVLNAGSYSVWNLHFANSMAFHVIGNDGGLLDAPVRTTTVRLAPAERVDLLVDFSTLAPGSTVELRNDERIPRQVSDIGEVVMPLFCRFRAGAGTAFRGAVPRTLRGGAGQPALIPPPATPDRIRTLTLSQPLELRIPPAILTLNNLEFSTTDIEMPRQGSVERWDLVNATADDPHPIHIHLVTFRILGRQPFDLDRYRFFNPQPPVGIRWTPSAEKFVTGPMEPPEDWEAGWKDTVRTDGGYITRVVARFPTAAELGFDPEEPFTALAAGHGGHGGGVADTEQVQGYVWHCHVLDHEDHDMMLRFRTVAP